MALTAGSNTDFGGRLVQETSASPTQGSDNCWIAGSPYPKSLTLAQGAQWPVEQGSSYGVDWVGLAPSQMGWYQLYSPNAQTANGCTIQYPQIMVINKETAGSPPTETYTTNQLIFTINQTQISVKRGNATATRILHF
jgi:hypothetical protein